MERKDLGELVEFETLETVAAPLSWRQVVGMGGMGAVIVILVAATC